MSWRTWQEHIIKPYGYLLRQTWYWVVGAGILSGGLVAIWQYSLPDEYLCEVEFVPPHLEELTSSNPALTPAAPEDLEKFLSFLQSPTLQARLVDSFKLAKHYGLEKIQNEKVKSRKLNSLLEDRIQTSITRNSTIRIRVYDEDPKVAHQIAIFLLESVKKSVNFYLRREESISELKHQLTNVEAQIAQLKDTLSVLRRKYKIITAPDIESGNFQVPYAQLLRDPEAMAHYDEILQKEFMLKRLTQLRVDVLGGLIWRERFLNTYPEVVWVIVEPYMPTLPERPKRLRWIALATLAGLGGALFLILYAHRLGLLDPSPTPEEVSYRTP